MNKGIVKSIKEWLNCYCGKVPTMYSLRTAFVQLLRYCFSNTDNYSDLKDVMGCLTYDPEGSSGSINIWAQGASDPANTDNIPGITVSLGEGLNYDLPAIRDWEVSSPDFSQHTVRTLGDVKLIIKCQDYNADVSCAMADLCMLFIMGVKLRILQTWGNWIKDIRVVQQTEPKLAQNSESDSSVKWYESAVVIHIKFEYAVDSVQESKRLKTFTLLNQAY